MGWINPSQALRLLKKKTPVLGRNLFTTWTSPCVL